MTIGDKIYKLRNDCGLSQEALANKLGVSRQSISKWETNQSIPDLDKINGIARCFNVSLDYLINNNLEKDSIMSGPNNSEFGLKIKSLQKTLRAFRIVIIGVSLIYLLSLLAYIFCQNNVLSIMGYNYQIDKLIFPLGIIIYNGFLIGYILIYTIVLAPHRNKSCATGINAIIFFIALGSFLIFISKYLGKIFLENTDMDNAIKYQLVCNVFGLNDWLFYIIIVLFISYATLNSVISYQNNNEYNKLSVIFITILSAILIIIVRVISFIIIY